MLGFLDCLAEGNLDRAWLGNLDPVRLLAVLGLYEADACRDVPVDGIGEANWTHSLV